MSKRLMKWHDNSTHPEPLTECLCEYTNPKNWTRFYEPMIEYKNVAWMMSFRSAMSNERKA